MADASTGVKGGSSPGYAVLGLWFEVSGVLGVDGEVDLAYVTS